MKETGSWKAYGRSIVRCAAIRSAGLVALCLAAMLLAPRAAVAAQEFDCMECHEGSPIDPSLREKSSHREMSCAECHRSGFDKDPHTGKASQAPSCMECHEGVPAWDEAAQEVKASVHVEMVDSDFSCSNCHDPHHNLASNALLDSGEGLAAFNKFCIKCHDVDELGAKHERLSIAALHLRRAACVACHTPAEERTVHLILPKSKAISDCAGCHSRETLLTNKFRTFLASKDSPGGGWSNAALYNSNVYVTGATSNRWLAWGALFLLAMTIAGVGAHALLRWFFGYIRRTS